MGYEAKEPVALCDGCRRPLYEGDEFWNVKSGASIITAMLQAFGVHQAEVHYCCACPCLERALVAEVRRIHGDALQAAAPDPNPLPPQDGQSCSSSPS